MVRQSDFTPGSPGRRTEIGGGFVAFSPAALPPGIDWSAALSMALSAADRALGELAGVGRTLPNPHLVIRPFLQKEAVLSSRIEGTRATLQDLLLFDLEPAGTGDVADTREVRNYVLALEHGLARLESLPIGTRLMLELHGILMTGVRGEPGAGEIRRLQVHIGPSTRLADATFIPAPANEIPELLGELEKFIHSEPAIPPLIRIALAHYQFEAIHPFHDGNGRIGRLLITLLLCSLGLLPQPLLYLSAYFERHRDAYIRNLREVSTRGDWNQWLVYFLEAVREQSMESKETVHRLTALRLSFHERLQTPRGSALLHKLVDALFMTPAITIRQAAELLAVTPRSAQMNVERLVSAGILREITGQKRNRIFIAQDVVDAVELNRFERPATP